METCRVRFKKLNEGATVPSYGTEFAAGADLYALTDEKVEILPGETKIIHTGVALEIPTGLVGLIYARSGLATREGLAPANKVGVIDSDYRGEIMVALYNQSAEKRTVENKERIAQIVIAPYIKAVFEECEDFSKTERGEGGFGSTGK